jgi:cation diffusion facilitator CzcD-associated flavoprotein CzcO
MVLVVCGGVGMGEREHEREHVRVAVVGSGFGGLGAAVRLRREGVTDFVVLERASRRDLAGQQLPGVRV